ncbi:MAG: hypothetical protein HC854_15350 [Flavobacterium sp.]|nr:hypothetical protein [Flavobacterium sp.]
MTHVKLNNRSWGNTVSGLVDELLNDLPVFPKDIFPSGRELTPVNVKETQDSFYMEIIAPGFQKSDFSVTKESEEPSTYTS